MPTTPNYGWEIPTEGGDPGIWDTTLNELFDDIDAQVFANQEAADDVLDQLLSVPTVMWGISGMIPASVDAGVASSRSPANGTVLIDYTAPFGGVPLTACPLLGLRPGTTLTTVTVRAQTQTFNAVGSLKLWYRSRSGSATQVGSAVPLAGGAGAESDYVFSALAHTILANVAYWVTAEVTTNNTRFRVTLGGVDVVVTA